ncbi:apyrase isoform X2 [Lepeophtheirus salmonis]|uniref:apyrase isoform X2 n=1 Tax=Lepeophtheirus salmonis TaxID=72036 RepID=UPI003AF40A73
MSLTKIAFLSFFGLLLQIESNMVQGEDLELTVLHVNDMHVRFEEINTYGGPCKEDDDCYGGIARLQYKVNEIKSSEKNVIFLNGGDFYQGNIWYSHFKWRAVAYFGNLLNFTAMSLGNHEFDDKVSGLVPFLNNKSFPCICANIDVSKEDQLIGKIPKSVVIQVASKKIGIIGYVTKHTDSISRPGKLIKFIDEVEAIDKEAKKLKSEGIDILIALGHSGYEEDKRIAEFVPDIDFVVGGHSHSFLYTTMNGVRDYPTIVVQSSGKQVPVVQAFAYTKYLGYLKVNISDENEITSWKGHPILLNNSIPKDEKILKELIPWKNEIKNYAKEILGVTNVLLLQSRIRETNLGNFITDAMVYNLQDSHDVYLSLTNSGGIRASLEIGNITRDGLLTVMPFEHFFDIITIKGKYLREAFEKSVSSMSKDRKASSGGFLQVSGFKLVYNLCNLVGSRLVSIHVRKGINSSEYELLRLEKSYKVVIPSYLRNGGDGYTLFDEHKESLFQGVNPDHVALSKYITLRSPINETPISVRGDRIKIYPVLN